MSLRDKFRLRHPVLPYDVWKRRLRRTFIIQFTIIGAAWIAAGAFTVWLLAR